jgi:hypothetical protein
MATACGESLVATPSHPGIRKLFRHREVWDGINSLQIGNVTPGDLVDGGIST